MDSVLGGDEESGVGLFEEEEVEADEIGDILSSRTGNEVKVKQDHEIDDLEVREMLGEDEGEDGLFSSNRKVVTKEEEDIKRRQQQQPAEKASLFQEVDSLEENLKRVDFGEDGGEEVEGGIGEEEDDDDLFAMLSSDKSKKGTIKTKDIDSDLFAMVSFLLHFISSVTPCLVC